jgi:hypothetical protein
MNFAAYAGARAAMVSLVVPRYGRWSADVLIALDDAVPDVGALVFGNLTLRGAVRRQALYGGSRSLRLVGGFGGWQKDVPAQQYKLSSGVRASLLLGDAARIVGERVNVPSDRVVGDTFTRANAPAAQLLAELAGLVWYVDASGMTQIADWPTGQIRSEFIVVDQKGGAGVVKVATEDYAEWMPNKTFTSAFTQGTATVCGVRFGVELDGVARVEVLTQ